MPERLKGALIRHPKSGRPPPPATPRGTRTHTARHAPGDTACQDRAGPRTCEPRANKSKRLRRMGWTTFANPWQTCPPPLPPSYPFPHCLSLGGWAGLPKPPRKSPTPRAVAPWPALRPKRRSPWLATRRARPTASPRQETRIRRPMFVQSLFNEPSHKAPHKTAYRASRTRSLRVLSAFFPRIRRDPPALSPRSPREVPA